MAKFSLNNMIIFVLLLLTACSVHKQDLETKKITPQQITVKEEISLIDQIKIYKKDKDFKKIIELYEKNIQEIKDYASLSYVMEAYFIENRFNDVIKVGEKVFADFPQLNDSRLNVMLGVSYYRNGLFEAARRNLFKAKDSGSKNPLISYYLVDLYIKKGQNALALNEAANLDEEAKDYIQGLVYYKEGNYSKALEKFSLSSSFKRRILYKAFAMYKLGRYDELLDEWEKGEMKQFIEIYNLVADIYFKRGEILKARNTLKDALKISDDNFTRKNLENFDKIFLFEQK